MKQKNEYEHKFETYIEKTLFSKLSQQEQNFIKNRSFEYFLTFSEFKDLCEIAVDFDMWGEKSVEELWGGFENYVHKNKQIKQKILNNIKQIRNELRAKPTIYNEKINYKNSEKIKYESIEKATLGLGLCPVASEKTRCCNLYTLDAVESCGFDCSYCSIQSFYNEGKVVFDKNFSQKLSNLNLDLNKKYHIGTGQSSDSLMWGNKDGILDSLCDFARKNSNVILELKTKSKNIDYFLKNEIPKNVIVTWSLNTQTIIDNEEHLSASLSERLNCAYMLVLRGIKVGFHFHPIIYYENYQIEYGEIINTILEKFNTKDIVLISFGTLTFIKPVIQKIRSRDFKSKILQIPMLDAKGKYSYSEDIKLEIFKFIYKAFEKWHKDVYFYMCMEEHKLWNDVFGYFYNSNDEFEADMLINYFKKIDL